MFTIIIEIILSCYQGKKYAMLRIYLHMFDNIYEIKIIFSRLFFSRLSGGENKCIVLQRDCIGAPFGGGRCTLGIRLVREPNALKQ